MFVAGGVGGGVVQCAAAAGPQGILRGWDEDATALGLASDKKSLPGLVARHKMTEAREGEIFRYIRGSSGSAARLAECGIVIEAIVESFEVKRRAFKDIEQVASANCILATNTSSLSVTSIAHACAHPERVIGIHFFNPPVVLPLVEIVPGRETSKDVTETSRALIESWGKTTVIASDTPGFIVNRIARPFYGEAIRIYEEGTADPATIDWAIRELGGFRMGPFELMDFIGNDVNLAATTAVYEGTNRDPRYKPSLTQQRLVSEGRHGRKTGRGHYNYAEDARQPEPR